MKEFTYSFNPQDIRKNIKNMFLTPSHIYDVKTTLDLQNFNDDNKESVLDEVGLLLPLLSTKYPRITDPLSLDLELQKSFDSDHFDSLKHEFKLNIDESELEENKPLERDYVRGGMNQKPFIPDVLKQEPILPSLSTKEQEDFETYDEFEVQVPGIPRNIVSFSNKTILLEKEGLERARSIIKQPKKSLLENKQKKEAEESEPQDPFDVGNLLDDILKDLAKCHIKAPFISEKESHTFAHVVNVDKIPIDFETIVPTYARKFSFKLDNFQKQAIYYLEKGDSVFVAAHTSAGKTVVAEYAISLSQKRMTKTIYTSPIKALSNQKYRDFRRIFGDDSVGILTGDIQISPQAPCLIMTTEILRSMLYKGADLIRDVEFVIFDEVHYLNDTDRGVVWEEVIIMLPDHVSLIMLSATVPNTKEFAQWIGRTKKKNVYVISTMKRPVPLEHYIYAGGKIHKIVDQKRNFLHKGWKDAAEILKKEKEKMKTQTVKSKNMQNNQNSKSNKEKKNSNTQETKRKDNIVRKKWLDLITFLEKKLYLPVVVFSFSKKKCEEYSQYLNALDLCPSSEEKAKTISFFDQCLLNLKGSDKRLPQIIKMKELLLKGIAVHHGGLLPIVKEIVEILFSRGLVKVLFATETFSMGVNMPTKTVVYSGLRKHDGIDFRDLLPGEYTQMSGRSGRRGLDDKGIVIIANMVDFVPETTVLNKMILGQSTRLQSQFKLSYNMILNLLKVEAVRVEEMIKKSFSENATQEQQPKKQKLITETERKLLNMSKLNCQVCQDDINDFYTLNKSIIDSTIKMNEHLSTYVSNNNNIIIKGRLVIINTKEFKNCFALLLKKANKSEINRKKGYDIKSTYWWCFVIFDLEKSKSSNLPVTVLNFSEDVESKIIVVDFKNVFFITKYNITSDFESILKNNRKTSIQIKKDMVEFIKKECGTDGLKMNKIKEIKYSKIKHLSFKEIHEARKEAFDRIHNFNSSNCAQIITHYNLKKVEFDLKNEIEALKSFISEDNIELLPDYHNRVKVLKELDYLNDNLIVELKGRVACEINAADELILTELIFANFFSEFDSEESVALLSCFVFQEKNAETDLILPSRLEKGRLTIYDIAEQIANCQVRNDVVIDVDQYIDKLKFGLVEVVYEWARGVSFRSITRLTEVQEGTIVRCITRLDDVCRDVRNAARLIGDTVLYEKMEDAISKIKRDIVFAASLYFQ